MTLSARLKEIKRNFASIIQKMNDNVQNGIKNKPNLSNEVSGMHMENITTHTF